MSPRILPFGESAVLVELDGLDAVLALHERLAADRPPGVIDLVPAARTILVHVDPRRMPLAAVRAWIARTETTDAPATALAPLIELPIVYDGADLAALAATLGIPPAQLAAEHAACEWTVAFTGFAPGFGYLVSADWPYDIPRLATPRTRVPAGAVGLAGAFSGAYPRESPGGWQLIGTTPTPLFTSAALLIPRTRVRFTPTPPARHHPLAETPALRQRLGEETVSRGKNAVRVTGVGFAATVQDGGRGGHAAEGVARAGAADRGALRTANRLLGNPEDAAGIEITMGGFRAVAEADLHIVITGAWGPIHIDGAPADPYTVHTWRRGTELHVDWFAHGARAYLAVRGGLDAAVTAGSRSTDTMSGLGPAPLTPGDVLSLAGPEPHAPIPTPGVQPWGPPADAEIELACAPGPREDWFADPSALYEQVWTVSQAADRVGVRLEGTPLTRIHTGELPSEGMLPGAIQVPPEGVPVILGPDGPVTGGYPVIAVLTDAAQDLLAQARPGTRIRFRHVR